MLTICSIDIGSNAMRLSIAEKRGDSYVIFESHREPIRLGHDVFRTQVISEETINASILAFQRFSKLCEKHAVSKIRAVGTSALREAKNADEFVRRMREASSIELSVISGEEEARLIQRAVASQIDLTTRSSLLIDIGGGSVEVTFNKQGKNLFSESVKLGAVRLLERFIENHNLETAVHQPIREYAENVRNHLSELGELGSVECAIGTGGNFEALVQLRKKQNGVGQANGLRLAELEMLTQILSGLSIEERIQKYDLRADRADVIVPACFLTVALMRACEVEILLVPKVGLKHGVLIELAALL